MNLQTVLGFTAVATLAILSPGPAVLLSLRNGATLGVGSVIWSALGNISGVCCLSFASFLGLGVVLKSSVFLFGAIKFAGAAYLIYIGVRHLLGRSIIVPAELDMEKSPVPAHTLYSEGFIVAATNPKAVLFFTALFPQFVDAKAPIISQFFALTGIFMVVSYLTQLTYATIASKAKRVLVTPLFESWLNRFVGIAFMFFGALLLTLRRQAI